jgi:CubicO group peptidase (beta-lactamase class C family)
MGPGWAEGLADRSTGRAASVRDPVRIASVSKLVVALGVLRLVEAGTLDLDADISGYLGQKVRNPAYPAVPLSLRLFLSHRSSLRDGVDYALPFDRTIAATLVDPNAWDPDHPPGGWFRYTNLNFPVIASVMERATGERFDRLMLRLVIRPLRLDACFNWSGCSDRAIARAVVLYQPDGHVVRDDLHGRRPACPIVPASDGSCNLDRWQPGRNGASFSPQGGLRISARDLARIGQMLLNDGRSGGRRFLHKASIDMLLTPLWRFDGSNGDTDHGFTCAYGLASETLANKADGCRDDPFGDGVARVGHAGEAYGVRSGLWIDRTRGTGIAYFATGLGDMPAAGQSAFTAAEERLARGAP